MKNSRIPAVAALFLAAVSLEAQQRPPVRQIGQVTAASAEKFAAVGGIRALANGSVLVNDVPGRRVLLFDPQLASFKVIADSTSATANAYGGRSGSLVAYRGDSSLFIDPASVSMLVLDGSGEVARVMAIPRADDAMALGGALLGAPVFDGSNRLIYRGGGGGFRMMGGPREATTRIMQGNAGAGPRPAMAPPELPDSAFIVAVDLTTRALDTLGYIRTPKTKFEIKHDENGMSMQSLVNPLPVVDDWAVLPDGTIAFVRGRDYHVDFVSRDGSKSSAAKIPFNWQRLTDEDKVAFLDSLKAARARLGANAPVPGAPGSMGGGGGAAPQVMVFSQTITGGPGGGGGPAPSNRPTVRPTEMQYVPASELPDYKPAFFAGSTRADRSGNLWIRTIPTEAIGGGPVYDVINSKGELVERVQVPEKRVIIGFGEGVVYMLNQDGATSTLEKAPLR